MILSDPKIPGAKIQLGELELVMPAMTVALLEDHEGDMERIRVAAAAGKVMEDRDARTALVTITHATLALNYPELTREDVRRRLSYGNAPPCIGALYGAAGFRKKEEGEPGGVDPQS